MSYPPARRDVAGYDLSLLYPVSDPIVGNIHPRDPLSAAAPLSSGPRQPQLYTTQVEKQHDSSAVAGYSPGAVSYARKEESASKVQEPVVASVPWYRTRRGIVIIIVAIIVVVVVAAVGGVVGGTYHGSKPKSDGAGAQNSGTGNTTTTQQGQESNVPGSASPIWQEPGQASVVPGSASPTLQGQASTSNAPGFPSSTNSAAIPVGGIPIPTRRAVLVLP